MRANFRSRMTRRKYWSAGWNNPDSTHCHLIRRRTWTISLLCSGSSTASSVFVLGWRSRTDLAGGDDMGAAVLNVILGVVAGIIVAFLGLALFDKDKLHRRISGRFGLNLRRSYARINTRTQVLRNFNAIWVSDVSDHSGRIL